MQKQNSPSIKSYIKKRYKPQHITAINTVDIQLPQPSIIYTHTQQFQFWQYPWTLAYLCKQTVLGLFNNDAPDLFLPPVEKQQFAQVQGDAKIFAEAIVGIKHRQPKINLPCQDAVKASIRPRPILILCDGAGSASVSELGSTVLTIQLTRLCQSIEPIISTYLDENHQRDLKILVRIIIRHAIGVLQDLSEQHRRSIRDFRSTLNLVIVGTERILWLKIGDGEIIQESLSQYSSRSTINTEYQFLGTQHKGEFANQTQFIDDQLALDDLQWGILDTETTTGLALMSDGTAEKLVSSQRDKVAGQLTQWLQQLRGDQLKVVDIYKRFYSEDFLSRSTGDDRSICLYSKSFNFS